MLWIKRTGLILCLAIGAALAVPQHGLEQGVNASLYKSGSYSRVKKERTWVLRNEGLFQLYWAEAFGQTADLAPTDIDWAREFVVAIHVGERRSGGHTLRLRSVERNRTGDAVVRYVEMVPSTGGIVTTVITSPYLILKFPKSFLGNVKVAGTVEEAPPAPRPRPRPKPRGCDCDCGCGETGRCGCGSD